MGIAIRQAMITKPTNSLDCIFHRLNIVAPRTLRIPISFVFCSATNEAKANKPRQEINMARIAKKPARFPILTSAVYFFAYSSSINLYSNGLPELYFLKTVAILDKASEVAVVGFIRMVITPIQPSQKKTDGSIGSYGDCVSISLAMPTMVYVFPLYFINSPTGFFNPVILAPVSLRMTDPESAGKSLEKSRPSFIFQPIVFPKSGVTFTSLK